LHEAGVDRGAAGADAGAQLVGQRLDDLEVLTRAHAAATRDHDLGRGEFRPLALGELGADIGRQALGAFAADRFDRRRAARGDCLEVGRTDGHDLDLVGGLHALPA
jgi:hypothetical protein